MKALQNKNGKEIFSSYEMILLRATVYGSLYYILKPRSRLNIE